MKVILKSTNQIKNVSFGYAVNFLIPRGLAIEATTVKIKELEKKQQALSKREEEKRKENELLAKKLAGKKLVIKKQVKKGDKIFGSVTKKEILSLLSVSNDRVEILLPTPIKKLGQYKLELKVGQSRANINLEVRAS